MFSKKKKEKDPSVKIFVMEDTYSSRSQSLTSLGLADTIYENITEEEAAARQADGGDSPDTGPIANGHLSNEKHFPISESGATEGVHIPLTSPYNGVGGDYTYSAKSPTSSPKLTLKKNRIYPMLPFQGEFPDEELYVRNGTYLTYATIPQKTKFEGGAKRKTNKKRAASFASITSDTSLMTVDQPPPLPKRKPSRRRESGVMLLDEPEETAVVYDVLPSLASRDLAGDGITTGTAGASSRPGSKTLKGKPVLAISEPVIAMTSSPRMTMIATTRTSLSGLTTTIRQSFMNQHFKLLAGSDFNIYESFRRLSPQADITNILIAKSPEEAWLASVELRLAIRAGETETLTLAQFKEALQVRESFFAERCFQLFDKDHDGEVNLQDVTKEIRDLVAASQEEKLRFLFNVYNIRGTGKLVKKEIVQVLQACINDSKLTISEENIGALADALIKAADKNKDNKISFEEFKMLVDKNPQVANNLAVSTLMSQKHGGIEYDLVYSQKAQKKNAGCCRHFTLTYMQNNRAKILFFFTYLLINIGLGAFNAWSYWGSNYWLITARTFGLPLDFNCTFIVVLMLRRVITYIRATPLVRVLPLDQHIMFHKLCGYMITLQSIGHTVAHVGNAMLVAEAKEMALWEVIFTHKAGIGWIAGLAPITGVVLCVVLLIMVPLSLPFIRRKGCFEIFYWSHKLYLIFWILLIIHAKNFWKWFVVPGLVFIVESITRMQWVRLAYMGRTYIQSACLLPSEVTHLVISRPNGFNFKAGDYVFIQIPVIAKYEWHPFTISSAPEQTDSIWLHIRTAGYWTKSLHDYFINYASEEPEPEEGNENVDAPRKTSLVRRESSLAWQKQKPLTARIIESRIRQRVITKCARVQCHIDGPYGTPSRHIFQAEHAVLIGSGIGITPFASILQSIVSRVKDALVKCPKCDYTWCNQLPASVMKLKKVDFIWINRDQRHFEWFVSLLSRLEKEQEVEGGIGHILDMHMYMTSAVPKTDMKGLGLQLALDLVHENERTDLITGLQTRTQAGRPDFDVLFRKISNSAKGRVTVFFCGSPMLGKRLKHISHKFGFAFRHEYF